MSSFYFINQSSAPSSKNSSQPELQPVSYPTFGSTNIDNGHLRGRINVYYQETGNTPPGGAVYSAPTNQTEFGSASYSSSKKSISFDGFNQRRKPNYSSHHSSNLSMHSGNIEQQKRARSFEQQSNELDRSSLYISPDHLSHKSSSNDQLFLKGKQPIRFSNSFIVEDMFDDLSMSSSTQSEKTHHKIPSTSAFSFINGSSNSSETLLESSGPVNLFAFEDSATRPKSIIKPDNELKLMKANAKWQRCLQEKQNQLKATRNAYDKQKRIKSEVDQLNSYLQEIETKKKEALAKEDYLQLQALSDQQNNITKKMYTLEGKTTQETLSSIVDGWKAYQEGAKQEAVGLKEALSYLQAVKGDKERQHAKFAADIQRKADEDIHSMEARQAELEHMKSSIAFDTDMWKKSDLELTERIEEATHAEKKQKANLEQKSQEITDEISELRSRLQELESQHQNVVHQVNQLDHDIKIKLKPFEHELRESSQERQAIQKRQQEVEEKSLLIEQEEKELRDSINRYQQEQERSKQELIKLQNQLEDDQKKFVIVQQTNIHLDVILSDVIQKRIEDDLEHQSQMQNLFNAASEKTDTIQIIKSRICEAEHNLIQFEDFVHQLKLQLSSLEKRKKLALKNSEFDTAATLAAEIKETKIILNNSLKTEQDSSTSDQDRAMLIKEADAFVDLIRQQGLLKKASKKDLETKLADAKSTLVNVLQSNEDAELDALIQCEIDSIQLAIEA